MANCYICGLQATTGLVVHRECLEPAKADNKPLALDELRGMGGEPVWCVDAKGSGKWALVHAGDDICTDADFGDWEFYCYGWRDGERLNENGWLAYRTKPEVGRCLNRM